MLVTTDLKKNKWTIILLLFIFTLGNNVSGQKAVDSTRVIRVLSFNILHGATMKGDFDLDRIASVIKSAKPDLVAMQEVDFNTNRARNMDLVTELAIRTGLAPLFGKAMSYDGGEYGEGILSGFSFLSTRNHALMARKGKEPRAALEGNVILESGDTVRFIATHLDHTKDNTDRVNQANQINQIFTKDDIPSILAGDLNASPDSEAIGNLLTEWTNTFSKNVLTFPSDKPTEKIDYILFRPAHRWKVLNTELICDEIVSDHCAILSVIELLPEK